MRSFSPRGRTSTLIELPFVSTLTSSGSTGFPADFASIVTFFCWSSDATTLTRPSTFLTESETFSGASSSFLKPWAKAGKHTAARSSSDTTNLLNNIADDLARSDAGGQAQRASVYIRGISAIMWRPCQGQNNQGTHVFSSIIWSSEI